MYFDDFFAMVLCELFIFLLLIWKLPAMTVVYQKPKLSAEKESFQLSAFRFGRQN